jgi:hypothetical protein
MNGNKYDYAFTAQPLMEVIMFWLSETVTLGLFDIPPDEIMYGWASDEYGFDTEVQQ